MDKLIGTNLLKAELYCDAKQLLSVKEFVILFYGASWDTKSIIISAQLNLLLNTYNKYEDKGNDVPKPKFEVIYASNDRSEDEFNKFLVKQTKSWSALNWNDHRLADLRKVYGLSAVPSVLVFDKNLQCITKEGADDLINLSTVACRNYWVDLLCDIVKTGNKN